MQIEVNNCKLFFDIYGSKLKVTPDSVLEKPTLIVLHGGHGFADHTLYVEFWSRFQDIAQVIFLDQRGCGRSDRRSESEWDLKHWGEDLYLFCEALGIQKPIIAGVSMGGHVMFEYLKHHSEHPGALIFCNTEARFVLNDICNVFAENAGAEVAEIARLQFTDPTPEITDKYQRLCVPHYANNAYTPRELARCNRRPEIFDYFCRNESQIFNYLNQASKIQCPTLFMAGGKSPMHPPVRAKEVVDLIPNGLGQLKVFENAGAPVYKDSEEETYYAVKEFINQQQGCKNGIRA